MGSAFLSPFFWWGGIVGLALLLIVISHAPTKRYSFRYGLCAGTVKMLMVGSWAWTVYPLDWIGDFSPVLEILGIGWVWFTGSVSTALGIGCFAYIAHWAINHRYGYWFLPAAYVVSEVLGSLFFSIFEYGKGGSINIHSSFGYLGYTLAGHGLLGLGALSTGVYGLSLLVGFLALALKRLWDMYQAERVSGTRIHIVYAVSILFVFGTYFLPPLVHPQDSFISVATVNTEFRNQQSFTQPENADRVRMLIEAFTAALKSESDVIVFPETANVLEVFGTPENAFNFIRIQTSRDVIVVDSDEIKDKTGAMNVRAVLFDTKTQAAEVVYKNYLVPGGEFVPYHVSLLMSLFGFGESRTAFDSVMAFVAGENSSAMKSSVLPGVLFCSESVSPVQVFRSSRAASLPLIVHPVSHAWFHHPETLFWYQLDLMNRVQVRMVGLPLVQAANMWGPLAYDAYGNPVEGKTIFKTASTSVVRYEF